MDADILCLEIMAHGSLKLKPDYFPWKEGRLKKATIVFGGILS